MKFKALLFSILTLAPLCRAMEPIEPIDQPQEQQPAQLTETERRKQTSQIPADAACLVCQDEAKDIPADKLKLTNCCQNVLCQDCETGIRNTAQANVNAYQTEEGIAQSYEAYGQVIRNQLRALCPGCRANLATRKAKLASTQKPIEIIDAYGLPFTLEDELAAALLKCTALEAYTLHEGVLDFSGLKKQCPFLAGSGIKHIASCINNPRLAAVRGSNRTLFEVAHYLGAPDNILFILANEAWPTMQEQKTDSPEIKEHKKALRFKARPHLCSPKHFLMFARSVTSGVTLPDTNKITLSFDILKYFYSHNNHGWFKHETTDWCVAYPFRSLDGIDELLTYLNANNDMSKDIDLSGHMLETFSCDMVRSINKLDLSGNQIKKLTGIQLQYNKEEILPSINLDNNPISKIDESFFQKIYRERSIRTTTSYCHISLKNNLLTAKQKKKAQQKFYAATHTLPERYITQERWDNITIAGGGLVGTATALYGCYKLANYAPNALKYISKGTAAILGGAIASLRELTRQGHNNSVRWFLFDIAAGAATSYLAMNKIIEKMPGSAKILPMIGAGTLGAGTGFVGGALIGKVATNKLAQLTHLQLNLQYDSHKWMGHYWNIEL